VAVGEVDVVGPKTEFKVKDGFELAFDEASRCNAAVPFSPNGNTWSNTRAVAPLIEFVERKIGQSQGSLEVPNRACTGSRPTCTLPRQR